MSEPSMEMPALALGPFLRSVLDARQISGNQLARSINVSTATINKLLHQGDNDTLGDIHPLVLRKVAEALDLDQVAVFQRASYIAHYEDAPQQHSLMAEYLAACYDALDADKQGAVLSLVHSLLGTNNKAVILPGQRLQRLVGLAEDFLQDYPTFQQDRFRKSKDQLGRMLGNLTRTSTQQLFLRNIVERINEVFAGSHAPIVALQVEQLVQNRQVALLLNYLLPRKEIPSAIEKLYWLSHPSGTLDIHAADLPDPQMQADIRALWLLLENVAVSQKK